MVTDACPLGAGAILLVNNRLIRAYHTKITHRDSRLLGFENSWEKSSSQGIAETLSVLLALKHWAKDLSSCSVELQVQSDSLVALATTSRLSSSTLTLNFLGAEIALMCEEIGIEGLRTSHIPGSANATADWLSRPDKVAKEAMPEELRGIPVHWHSSQRARVLPSGTTAVGPRALARKYSRQQGLDVPCVTGTSCVQRKTAEGLSRHPFLNVFPLSKPAANLTLIHTFPQQICRLKAS